MRTKSLLEKKKVNNFHLDQMTSHVLQKYMKKIFFLFFCEKHFVACKSLFTSQRSLMWFTHDALLQL